MLDGLDVVTAPFAYEGSIRQLVLAVKYRRDRSALAWLALQLAEAARPLDLDPSTTVTWPTTTAARRRGRGFDQGELLARRVAAELGLPARRLLRRLPGPPQTGRTGVQRHEGPAFVARRRVGSVLLVDDVVTTGATLRTAARALRQAGSWAVSGAAAAATGRGSTGFGTSASGQSTLSGR